MANNKTIIYYLFYFIIIILFNFFIFTNGQITPNSIPDSLTVIDLPSQLYQQDVSDDWETCQFNLDFIINNANLNDEIETITCSLATAVFVSNQNVEASLFNVQANGVQIGSHIHNITATSKLGVSIEYSLYVTCLGKYDEYDINSLDFKLYDITPFRFTFVYQYLSSYLSPIVLNGFKGSNKLANFPVTQNAILPTKSDSFYVYWFPQTLHLNYFNFNLTTEIKVLNNTFSFSVQSPFSDLVNEEITNVVQYPSESLIAKGLGYTPLVTFVSPSMKSNPYLVYMNSASGELYPKPISGKAGSIKYITFYREISGSNSQTLFNEIWYQNGSNIAKIPLSVTYQSYYFPDFSQILIVDFNDPIAPLFGITYSTISTFNPYLLKLSDFGVSTKLPIRHTFPYGFAKGNNDGFDFKAACPKVLQSIFPSFLVEFSTGSAIKSLVSTQSIQSNEQIVSYSKPLVTNYEINQIKNSVHLVRLFVKDSFGISYIRSIQSTFVNTYAKLSFGTIYDGFYEITVSLYSGIQIDIVNNVGQKLILNDGTFILLNPPKQFLLPSYLSNYNINFSSFKNVSFLHNNLNLLNQTSYNVFYFNSSDIPIEKPMFFVLNDPYSFEKRRYPDLTSQLPIVWNSTLNMFNCKFILTKNNMYGDIQYVVQTADDIFYFDLTFENPVPLTVTSTYLDNLGPIITEIVKLPSDPYIVPSAGGNVGWRLTIEDEYNGFDKGYIKVMGKVDSAIYHFNFTLNDKISGDKWKGVYEFTFPLVGSSFSQDYVITIVHLYDENNVFSEFDVFGTYPNPSVNPFIYFMDDDKANTITIEFENPIVDSSPPQLVNFTASTNLVDVGKQDRAITFEFEATDNDSGLRIDQYPVVYVTSRRLDIGQCVSEIVSIVSNSTIKYNCTVQLEVGFAFPGIVTYSVYGFINNGGFYSGYTALDLKDLSFQFYSNVTYSIYDPVIIGVEPFTSEGGQLIVYGKGLLNINEFLISYLDEGGKDFNNSYDPSHGTSSYIVVDNIKPTTLPFIIRVGSLNGPKITYTVYPIYLNIDYSKTTPSSSPTITPTPTPTLTFNPPKQCLGNPVCGGLKQGYCNQDTGNCVCYSPWIGPSCLSQVIIVPKPNTNVSEPTIEIPIPQGDNSNIFFKSLISLISLRELDFKLEPIKSFQFDKWIQTTINENSNLYQTNITTNPNGSSIDGSVTTVITVKLEWFTKETIIEFASTNLTMNPSTIKYTIDITKYAFSSELNSLQLVLSALFLSDSDNVCSVKEFGEINSDSNFVKIQIDDHSLYGRFIKRAIIDSKVATITNVLLDNSLGAISSSSSQQSYIGITIPKFDISVEIDPDFSVLVDSKPVSSDDKNSICKSLSSSLTTSQLVGIIVGSIAFVAVIAIILTYYIIQKRRDKKFFGSFSNKLDKIK